MSSEIEVETRELREKLEEVRAEEEEARSLSQSWIKWVALSTALMAVMAAMAALQASFHGDEALLLSNEAILSQAKASDTWNEFQADGLKDILRQIQATQATDPAQAEAFRVESQNRSNKAGDEFNVAQDLEKERDQHQAEAARAGNVREHFAWSVGALQVGIALASVAALTRRKSIWYLGGGFGAAGATLLGWGFAGA